LSENALQRKLKNIIAVVLAIGMDRYEAIFIVLSLITIVIVLVQLINVWAVAITFLILLLIIVFQRSEIRKGFISFQKIIDTFVDEQKKKNEENQSKIEGIKNKLEEFLVKIDAMKEDLRKDIFAIENRVIWERNENKTELEEIYTELTRKLLDIEKRIEENLSKEYFDKKLEDNYRDLAKKIMDVENNLNHAKKMLTLAITTVDDRVSNLENKIQENKPF